MSLQDHLDAFKAEFHSSAPAIFTAGVLIAGALGWPGAGAQTAVPIKSNDIGGIVASANGPEAGVWVIAETRELPTRFARMVVTMIRAAMSCPICRKPIIRFGCAATDWSKL